MMKKRELLAGLALLPLAAPALAQEYPSRPIRLLVGFAAGGSTDVFARAIAPRMQALLGQPVVIENRPGAGGIIGMETLPIALLAPLQASQPCNILWGVED